MRLQMLDYRIDTFLTLYNEMNYRRTAEKLNMTQPGVTQHIHYLENFYKVKLFSYNGKTLLRTQNAEILKKHIDSVMLEEKETINMFLKREGTVLNIGATKSIGEFVLLPVVREFLKDENNSVNLRIENTEVLLRMIKNGEIDFAIVEGIFDKTKYPNHLYRKENFVGVCSKTHPFAGKIVEFTELLKQSVIVTESESGTRRLLEKTLYENGFALKCFNRILLISNFSVILDMVAKDNYITLACESVAKSRSDLATFEVKDMAIKGELNFVYSNSKIANKKINLLFGDKVLAVE